MFEGSVWGVPIPFSRLSGTRQVLKYMKETRQDSERETKTANHPRQSVTPHGSSHGKRCDVIKLTRKLGDAALLSG